MTLTLLIPRSLHIKSKVNACCKVQENLDSYRNTAPAFISDEYELFSKFVQKYYEAQEVQGGTLDIINNIQKYADIDYYEKNLLKQNDILDISISASDTTIQLKDASSFLRRMVTLESMMRSSSMHLELILHYKSVLEVLVVIQHLVTYTILAILSAQLLHHTMQDKRYIMLATFSYMH